MSMLVKALCKFHSSARVGAVSEVPDEIARMAIDKGMAISAETLGAGGLPDPTPPTVLETPAEVAPETPPDEAEDLIDAEAAEVE